jgi:hypothetical protein
MDGQLAPVHLGLKPAEEEEEEEEGCYTGLASSYAASEPSQGGTQPG